jgi:glutaredoxin
MPLWLQRTLDSLHPARSARKIQRSPEQQHTADQASRHLVLYHFRTCPYCLRTRRAIDRLNIGIALRDIHRDATAYDELIAGGGRQTVPCLRIDEGARQTWLYESGDIIRYLEQRFIPRRGAA